MMTSHFDEEDFKDHKSKEDLKQRLISSKIVKELFTISDASRLLKVNYSVAQVIVKRMADDGLLEVVISRNNKTVNKYRRAGLAAYWLSIPWKKTHE